MQSPIAISLLAKIYILANMFVGRVCYLPKFTFWQVCSLVVFVSCQNLHFGKYVRWSCLLLAKIYILASMFVGRVCYLPKFDFGKYVRWSCLSVCYLPKFDFGKYVRWSCLSGFFCYLLVCLFVCTEISQNLKDDSVNHHQTWSQASTSP